MQKLKDMAEQIIERGKAAIFDFDGTLIDSMSVWQDADERFLNSKGVEAEAGLGDKLFAMSMEAATEYLRVRYQLPMTREEITEEIIRIVHEEYFFHIPEKKGVRAFLDRLREHKIPLIMATSCEPVLVEGCLKRLKLRDYFEEIFTCAQIGVGKDKPDIYFAAAKYAGTKPEETWVFEDALHAAKTAKSAGFLLAGVYDSFSEKMQKELCRIADVYIKSFEGKQEENYGREYR